MKNLKGSKVTVITFMFTALFMNDAFAKRTWGSMAMDSGGCRCTWVCSSGATGSFNSTGGCDTVDCEEKSGSSCNERKAIPKNVLPKSVFQNIQGKKS